jgi:hypothetical protein
MSGTDWIALGGSTAILITFLVLFWKITSH